MNMDQKDLNGTQKILTPEIDGEWWRIAHNPDLGKYNKENQETTSFGIWQAVDGTWQLWGCVRNTACGGNTRLFHRWEADKLTDENWEPKGVVMTAEPNFGEALGGMQSPIASKVGNEYALVYGDWGHICLARSEDGKTFARQLGEGNKAGMFDEGEGSGTRDPFLLEADGSYYLYYAANPDEKGAIYCRTSKDLRNWSDSKMVSFGGHAGTRWDCAEVPVVIPSPKSDAYYHFRMHADGPPDATGEAESYVTSVYRSKDLLDFGINDDRYYVTTLPAVGARILKDDDQYYIASVRSDNQGYEMSRLKWVEK